MPKFMCTHTLAPQSLTRQQVEQVSDALQRDPLVHGYRSFMNLSQGKIQCILEAPDRPQQAHGNEQAEARRMCMSMLMAQRRWRGAALR